MSAVATAIVGSAVIGGVLSSKAQSDAAESAAGAQNAASEAQLQASRDQIAESRRQFDSIQQLLSPYTNAGPGALWRQQALLGQHGDEYQKQQVDWVANNPNTQALMQQGENAMLQNASATGGLRGGNIQGALAQFRPALLNQELDKYYNRLGGMATTGQNSAAGVASAGQNSSNQIMAALGQGGAAQAGGYMAQAGNYLAQGRAGASLGNSIAGAGGLLGSYLGRTPTTTTVNPSGYAFGGDAVASSPYGFGGTSTFGQPAGGYY